MKRIHGDTKKRALGLCMLIATLFGSAVARADVVLDWNVIAVNTAIANGQNPFAQARSAAIVQLAVFESVNAITGEYHPYLGTIVAPPGASADAAAIQAAYRVLSTYFPASASTQRCSCSSVNVSGINSKTTGWYLILALSRAMPVARIRR